MLVISLFHINFDNLPGRRWVRRNDLHRFVESLVEPSRQIGVAVDDRPHRLAQPVGVQWTGNGDIELHGVHVVVAVTPTCVGLEQQSVLQRCQR
ncbi:Uncharacterised protein [Mycobacteroides abscessus subsp. abscessus]|nr:Uncharacterised protein [Mycobacteroides abscessus subsp. abscessus]